MSLLQLVDTKKLTLHTNVGTLKKSAVTPIDWRDR